MMYPPGDERLGYSATEAAEVLGVHRNTLARLVREGKIKPNRALRYPLFPRAELERFLNSKMNK